MEAREFNERLINTIVFEMNNNIRNGVFGFIQREMAYNSNRIEGSRLSKEQTENLFNTGTVFGNEIYVPKDIEETTGHFAMFNYMVQSLNDTLSEDMIKKFHKLLKQCVFEDLANGYNIGEYKGRPNIVGDTVTVRPEEVASRMHRLLKAYHSCNKSLESVLVFHSSYEYIHPFQDGNGRTGRMIMLRECITNEIIPFIVRDENKVEYISVLKKVYQQKDVTQFVEYAKKEQEWFVGKTIDLLL